MKLNLIFTAACFLLSISMPAFADNYSVYFSVLAQITKPPIGSTPILAVNNPSEQKHIINLIKQSDPKTDKFESSTIQSMTLDSDNHIFADGDLYVICKGNFSNENAVEYALVSTGGTGNYNVVSVYKLIDGHLVNTHFNKLLAFDYGWVANPFAYTKNGKTYIRFMDYPGGRTYDETALKVCTYLWQGNKIPLSGPNLKYSKKQKKLVEATDCIGDPRTPA